MGHCCVKMAHPGSRGSGIYRIKHTQWVDLQICEEQVLIEIKEPNDETGQQPAERQHLLEAIEYYSPPLN